MVAWSLCIAWHSHAQNGKGGLEFYLATPLKTQQSLVLTVRNTSAQTYILPVVNGGDQEMLRFLVATGDRSLYFINPRITNAGGVEQAWNLKDCFAKHSPDEFLDALADSWTERLKTLSVNDVLVLHPGQEIQIQMPFYTHLDMGKRCSAQLDAPAQELFMEMVYYGRDAEFPPTSERELQSIIQSNGYAVYRDRIVSNKVHLPE